VNVSLKFVLAASIRLMVVVVIPAPLIDRRQSAVAGVPHPHTGKRRMRRPADPGSRHHRLLPAPVFEYPFIILRSPGPSAIRRALQARRSTTRTRSPRRHADLILQKSDVLLARRSHCSSSLSQPGRRSRPPIATPEPAKSTRWRTGAGRATVTVAVHDHKPGRIGRGQCVHRRRDPAPLHVRYRHGPDTLVDRIVNSHRCIQVSVKRAGRDRCRRHRQRRRGLGFDATVTVRSWSPDPPALLTVNVWSRRRD
jgi:hypothetical protein